ncbi:MAG: alpha/beta hydrolase [Candidatus Rokubacteria bacterium]|nr:alpha/beta hydrolase [Candidatus Rokubacteria bacterium]
MTPTGERHAVPILGGALALILHLPDTAGRADCVVACHGLGASKDSDKYLLFAAEFPPAGLALARFDFRGCGESAGVEEATTVATRLEDARAVLVCLGSHPRLSGRFGLLGSSMGGYVALHLAAERGDGLPVVTWNAPVRLDTLRVDRTAPGLGKALVSEVRAGRYAEAPPGVRRHLVIQAEADDVVPPEHGRALHARAAEPRALVAIAGGDHRLTEPRHRTDATARSLEWFRRFLKELP